LAALTTSGILLTLPSVLTVSLVGVFFFELRFPPLAVLVLILSAYAMSGLGAFIGFWSPTAQVAGIATQVIQALVILFAPVYIPFERLPHPLQVTAHLLPTTYAAQALREAVAGGTWLELWPEMLILFGFATISLGVIPLKLDWRGGS
jgi:ABC-2 type transport system permease protein